MPSGVSHGSALPAGAGAAVGAKAMSAKSGMRLIPWRPQLRLCSVRRRTLFLYTGSSKPLPCYVFAMDEVHAHGADRSSHHTIHSTAKMMMSVQIMVLSNISKLMPDQVAQSWSGC